MSLKVVVVVVVVVLLLLVGTHSKIWDIRASTVLI